MKIFGSEVHDTALVFIGAVILQCFVGGVVMGSQPSQSFSKLIVFIASIAAFVYWFFTYYPLHFKK